MALVADLCCIFFFFFKQKTAYEMRISDWSSDVCSSDLADDAEQFPADPAAQHRARRPAFPCAGAHQLFALGQAARDRQDQGHRHVGGVLGRSEEHTSELQSLMRISYAVFCLKKKNHYINQYYLQQVAPNNHNITPHINSISRNS